jgi:hypothetical protein
MENYGVEIRLKADFLVIKETLERIGIANRETKVITPSCYILHKRGRYYVIHFKELLALDGFKRDISEGDLSRRDAIASLLQNWNMVSIIPDDVYQEELEEQIFVLPYSEKKSFTINHKYRMSRSRKK